MNVKKSASIVAVSSWNVAEPRIRQCPGIRRSTLHSSLIAGLDPVGAETSPGTTCVATPGSASIPQSGPKRSTRTSWSPITCHSDMVIATSTICTDAATPGSRLLGLSIARPTVRFCEPTVEPLPGIGRNPDRVEKSPVSFSYASKSPHWSTTGPPALCASTHVGAPPCSKTTRASLFVVPSEPRGAVSRT